MAGISESSPVTFFVGWTIGLLERGLIQTGVANFEDSENPANNLEISRKRYFPRLNKKYEGCI